MTRKIIQIVDRTNSHYPISALCDDGSAWTLGPDDWIQVKPIPQDPGLSSKDVAHTSRPNAEAPLLQYEVTKAGDHMSIVNRLLLNLHKHEVIYIMNQLDEIDALLDALRRDDNAVLAVRLYWPHIVKATTAVSEIRRKLGPTASVTGARPNV